VTSSSVSHRVVITGATGGVGRGIALACASAGWEVWIAARREAEGRAVANEVDERGGAGRFVECDVANEASVRAVFASVAEHGPLHGVVHNATSSYSSVPRPATDLHLDELGHQVAVGLRGCHLLARGAHEPLRETSGSFLVLTSEAGFEGKKLLSTYATVKAAQRGYMRVLAREWGIDGVRVNALAPLASSPAMDDALRRDPEMRERVMRRNPLGRLGDAELDIGPVARFLLCDDSRFVTGQTIMADGGSCPIT
jgi:NAD(P)-dependent dehydrogenase (short-subunit alcohol dehydrogenase family)